jgi:Na+-transporting NADH:ubiquinone oxidoreductase subunit NqrB
VTARLMIMRWISLVPSKMVKIWASRCQRSTGKSRV